jgi:hypothetical protein
MVPPDSDGGNFGGDPHSPDQSPEGPGHPQAIPDVLVLVKRRPLYTVQIDGTVNYCQNTDAVVLLLAQNDRVISVNDVYKSLNIAPHSQYRLLERLNGAIITKIPPFIPN